MRTKTAAAVLAAMTLAACGGGEAADDTQTDARAEARQASLKFAKCMRDNGVDMPDPKVGEGGGFLFRADGSGGKEEVAGERFRKAEGACRHHLKDLRPPDADPEKAKEFRGRALAFAKCMRENGVDMPDPQPDAGGNAIRVTPGDGFDPSSPRFQRAEKACRDKLGGPGGGEPAGVAEVAP